MVFADITGDGEVKNEVTVRLGKAARAFGCLCCAVFQNPKFSVVIK